MENQIKNIELINSYLNKTLSEQETNDFERRIKENDDFRSLYEEHVVLLEGIKRQQLIAKIKIGKQRYIRSKWLRYLGIITGIVLLTVLVFIFKNLEDVNIKKSEPAKIEVSNLEPTLNLTISDSSSTKEIILVDTLMAEKTQEKQAVVQKEEIDPQLEIEEVNIPKKPSQSFKFNTKEDRALTCKEGTKLTVKANSFVDQNNKIVTGEIDLKVTEYYKLSDILLANLTTQSNGKQLETGGMLYMEAFSGSKPLKLKEGANIDILFASKSRKKDMQLFSGEWQNGNINWKLKDEFINQEVEIELVEEQIEVPFTVIETPPAYPGCENLDKSTAKKCTSDAISKFVQRKFNTEIADMLGLTGRRRVNVIFKINKKGEAVDIRARSARKELEEEAIRVISLLPKMKAGKQRGKVVTVPYSIPIVFTVGGNVNTGNSSFSFKNIVYDTIYKQERGRVERVREVMHDKDFVVDSTFMKTWEAYENRNLVRFINSPNGTRKVVLRKPLFEMEDTKFKVLENDSISRGGHVIRELWDETKVPTTSISMTLKQRQNINIGNEIITEKEFEKRLQSKTDTTIKTGSVNTYVLRTTGLGWINCDRFVRRNNLIKYRFKIENAYDARVSMVFKSVNSVLPSRRSGSVYDFKMVPRNEEVTLVAIKKQEGKLYFDILETKTLEIPNIEFEFKEIGLEELKREMEKIAF